ncbi:MAG: Ribonuclease 3 [Candidatus Uhrbacteria bacterium GW2011_GWD2_41_121]|uniref:Ribonuclease 3 n=1 Tax=Candidatus Uhrbacteria bacterium GW2011_GWC1_41_20 TaxID=1618983 RepID=A0A0G0VG44_9BACT|nr:MAG: Ribonuclease 3 [Candidatus Uhrbacteria bacterium GW2011_GWE1_39_46]KKR64391.1 MAG: Ribonuclease 3 [Candidatus Uhrbacteria bacterium GW2011_GWC2_40_450]KKR89847.1 MAG: Ribonuclease 3 [Candidatus Uhrbacteria bacterium GW2011_GWE2_41_1153]KKR90730.1 MAG: Ribonuclease 3 [Candidatus Uhrbacteria bacterium GW2011_GWD2_41_121]KKR96553.1 MAG: Ribonuclease 3 [Candidatus Uhrbacteria bacterium GW2011_GWD1_41_16]KKR99944.1 MAG: Ribonuclease 3 [Candidatus Uhrbacteria bacterium GW2011_GWC1_41_20]KKS
MNEDKELKKFAKSLGISYLPDGHFKQALVHRSYLNEHADFPIGHNERLEFLGDAVLELVVTEYLFESFDNPEGELTNYRAALVNGQNLAKVARTLEVEPQLYLSKGEAQDTSEKSRNYILANSMEAIIGSLYLDFGWEESKNFIHHHIISTLPDILEKKLYIDPKSRFQEESQSRMSTTPSYKVLEESGPDHKKTFRVGAFLGKELVAEGLGTSKQEGQVEAAQNALEAKGW